jgi:hypothetical protein
VVSLLAAPCELLAHDLLDLLCSQVGFSQSLRVCVIAVPTVFAFTESPRRLAAVLRLSSIYSGVRVFEGGGMISGPLVLMTKRAPCLRFHAHPPISPRAPQINPSKADHWRSGRARRFPNRPTPDRLRDRARPPGISVGRGLHDRYFLIGTVGGGRADFARPCTTADT